MKTATQIFSILACTLLLIGCEEKRSTDTGTNFQSAPVPVDNVQAKPSSEAEPNAKKVAIIIPTKAESKAPDVPQEPGTPVEAAPEKVEEKIVTAVDDELNNLSDSADHSITLSRAVQVMLELSPEVKSAEERVREYQYYTDIARKRYFPVVEVGASYTKDEKGNDYTSYMVSFSQVIWDGTFTNNIKLNVYRQQAEEMRVRAVKRAMTLQTIQKYLGLIKNQGALKAQETQLNVLKRIHDEVKAAYVAGLIPKQTMLEAIAELKKGEFAYKEALGRQRESCAQLLMVLNERDYQLCRNPQPVAIPSIRVPATEDEAFQLALKNRPEIMIDGMILKAAEMGVKLTRAEFYPRVVLTTDYGFSDNPYSGGANSPPPPPGLHEDWQVGVGVRIPIFDGGRRKRNKQAAEARVAQAQSDLLVVQRQVLTDVATVLINLDTAKAGLEAAAAAELASKNLYEESKTAYRLGSLSLTDYLLRVSALNQSELRTLETNNNLIQSLYSTSQALGEDPVP